MIALLIVGMVFLVFSSVLLGMCLGAMCDRGDRQKIVYPEWWDDVESYGERRDREVEELERIPVPGGWSE